MEINVLLSIYPSPVASVMVDWVLVLNYMINYVGKADKILLTSTIHQFLHNLFTKQWNHLYPAAPAVIAQTIVLF